MPPGGPVADVGLDPGLLDPLPRDLDEVRVTRVAPGLLCLRIPLPFRSHHGAVPFIRPGVVNCYLLEDDAGWFLIDCGPRVGLGWPALERALELAAVAPSQVHTLVLTHLHPDHASLAADLVERCSWRLWRAHGPGVWIDRLRDATVPFAVRRDWARREGVPPDVFPLICVPVGRDRPGPPPAADRLLDTGDLLTTRSGRWRVHAAPGHSATQIVLVEDETRQCISADAVYPEGFAYLEYGQSPDPMQEALTTLRQLATLGITRFHPGHGRPDDDAAGRLASAERSLLQAIDAFRRELADGGALNAYEIACRRTAGSTDPDQRASAVAFALAIGEHLILHGEVEATRDHPDGTRRFRLRE